METDEALLRQYEVFSERKLHFGRLFWQIPAVFVALCVVLASVFRDARPPLLYWLLLVAGVLLLLIGYVAHRLRVNEDLYEGHMRDIEIALRASHGERFQIAPLSRKFGARFWTTVMIICLGMILAILSVVGLVLRP